MNSLGPTRQGRCPFEWWKARPRSLDPNSPFYVLICSWMMKCIWPSVSIVTSANLTTRQRGENFSGSCWKKAIFHIFAEPEKMQIFFLLNPDQTWQQGAGGLHWEVDCKQEAKSATATSSVLSITGWPTKFFLVRIRVFQKKTFLKLSFALLTTHAIGL